jgi:hypothetical protein
MKLVSRWHTPLDPSRDSWGIGCRAKSPPVLPIVMSPILLVHRTFGQECVPCRLWIVLMNHSTDSSGVMVLKVHLNKIEKKLNKLLMKRMYSNVISKIADNVLSGTFFKISPTIGNTNDQSVVVKNSKILDDAHSGVREGIRKGYRR